jgi:hypothetical protein
VYSELPIAPPVNVYVCTQAYIHTYVVLCHSLTADTEGRWGHVVGRAPLGPALPRRLFIGFEVHGRLNVMVFGARRRIVW